MPSSGDGTGWDTTIPSDSANVSDTGLEIRDVKKAVAIRSNKEHSAFAAASGGGVHKAGSAKAYYQTTFPSKRPDGTTDLDADDAGRILYKSNNKAVYVLRADGEWNLPSIVDKNQIQGIIDKTCLASGFTKDIFPLAILIDQKADGTDGGTLSSGSGFQTRTLNLVTTDVGAIIKAVAANRFTLGTGTYRIRFSAPAYKVDQHQCRLRDITNTSTISYGSSEAAGSTIAVMTRSVGECHIDVVGDTDFEIQHAVKTTRINDGAGIAGSFGGAERYTMVAINKLL